MTRYANIIALSPRSSCRAADDHEPQVVTSGVSPDLWVSVAVYKLVCAVDGLIQCVVNSPRTTVREPSSEPTTRQGKSSIDIDHHQKILSALYRLDLVQIQRAEPLRKPRPLRILQPARKRLATLRRWYRRRVKPAVRRWVDDYLAATKENGS